MTFGCRNWLPNIENENDLLELKDNMKTSDLTPDDACTNMRKLYPLLRKEICDGCPHVSELKTTWPHFFNAVVIKEHFAMLTEIDLFEVGDQNWRNVMGDIIRLSNVSRRIEKTKEIMSDFKDHKKKGSANTLLITSIRILFLFFNEKVEDFIFLQPVSGNMRCLTIDSYLIICLI